MRASSEIYTNPFSVKTPESLTAEELVDLFVPYPEFENLQVSGHQFLDGHRGSGKSMMLRMMSPDSQLLHLNKKSIFELPYFGVYLSIKATELNAPEYARLDEEPGGSVLSEHVLTTKLLSSLFQTIQAAYSKLEESAERTKLLHSIVTGSFFNHLKYAGWSEALPASDSSELKCSASIMQCMLDLIDHIHLRNIQYIKRRSFSDKVQPYQGTLLGFQDILLPFVKELTEKKIIPAPVYFLLDDADNLNLQQTKILNTWVSYRSTQVISLKISTQLNYKTKETTSGIRIEAPHDFSSINFTAVQTGSVKERYPKLIENIVKKRLARYGLENTDPYAFFPVDEEQEKKIAEIGQAYKDKWRVGDVSGYRAGDASYRYARPEYIRRISGNSKQGSTYKYAGFDQLVHISSGIVRFFLEPASRMFTVQHQKDSGKKVEFIPPSVQHHELKREAEQLLLHNFAEMEQDIPAHDIMQQRDIQQLRNLVSGIGSLFKAHILNEKASQRRVFSFSVSDELSSDIRRILHLGVIYGYFYKGSIGEKSRMGRVTLYVLTRRLAPAFLLDPMGFSGYLTVTNGYLQKICKNPRAYTDRLKDDDLKHLLEAPDQLSLLEGHENDKQTTN